MAVSKRGKLWYASIVRQGENIHLGGFETKEDALAHVEKAKALIPSVRKARPKKTFDELIAAGRKKVENASKKADAKKAA